MPFFNTKDVGPVVLEIPLADDGLFNGSIMNYWQAAIEDVGPGGVDKGKGGKYAFLPRGYEMDKLPLAISPCHPKPIRVTLCCGRCLKSGSDADIAKAVIYSKRLKLYPLSQAANPPVTAFVDASGIELDSTIRYDVSFFASLNQMVQAEPWLERDKAMIDRLRPLASREANPSIRTRRPNRSSTTRSRKPRLGSTRDTTSCRLSTKASLVLPNH